GHDRHLQRPRTGTASCAWSSVAEDSRVVVTDPLPEWSSSCQPGARAQLTFVQLPGVKADRAHEQLPATAAILLEDSWDRGAAVAGDSLRLAVQRQPDGLLGEEHHDLSALIKGCSSDEERHRHPFGVFESGGEIDHNLVACHVFLPQSR